MTRHENKFLITGLALGLMLALVAYAAMRLWHPDRSAAQSHEAPMLKYEATPEQATFQRAEQAQASLKSTVAAYQADRTDFLNLLDSQNTTLEVELDYYRAASELESQIADLERAVGTPLTRDGHESNTTGPQASLPQITPEVR